MKAIALLLLAVVSLSACKKEEAAAPAPTEAAAPVEAAPAPTEAAPAEAAPAEAAPTEAAGE